MSEWGEVVETASGLDNQGKNDLDKGISFYPNEEKANKDNPGENWEKLTAKEKNRYMRGPYGKKMKGDINSLPQSKVTKRYKSGGTMS